MEVETRIVGALAFIFVSYSLWMGQMTLKGLPDGYRNPVLALELVKNGADIESIKNAEGGKAVAFMRLQLYKDFGYILLYVVLFCALAMLLAKTGPPTYARWCWLAAACAILSGLLDLLENRGMLKALALPSGAASDALAHSIRFPSLAKWAMLFIYCLLIGMVLLSRQTLFLRIPSIFFLLAAVAGLGGVLLNLLKPRFYLMFPVAIMSWGLAILCIVFVFTIWPAKVFTRL